MTFDKQSVTRVKRASSERRIEVESVVVTTSLVTADFIIIMYGLAERFVLETVCWTAVIHCALSLAAQCIVIGSVSVCVWMGLVCVCVFVCVFIGLLPR